MIRALWTGASGMNAQQVSLPVRHQLVPQDFLQFILKTAEGHIKQEEHPCRKEVYEPEQKSRAVGVVKSYVHAFPPFFHPRSIILLCFIPCNHTA